MPVVRANGLSFHTQQLGEQGPPVVMAHGLLLGNLASWYFSAASALRKQHRVLLYDLRGHGKTERVADGYDVPTMSRDLAALIEPFAPEAPVDLVGHSYGGLVVLRYALDHPDRVRRLVLVDVPLPPSTSEEIEFCRRVYGHPDPEAVADVVRAHVIGGRRGARRFAGQLCFLVNESTAVSDLEAERDVSDDELAGLHLPVLCLYGKQSACRPTGRRLAAVLPRAELQELDGGHFLTLDNPVGLARAIATFLGDGRLRDARISAAQ